MIKQETQISLTVLIPSFNPVLPLINAVIDSLKSQTLQVERWELIVIDNNSSNSTIGQIDLSWHPNHRVLKEQRQGLTFARLCGFQHARGDIIVMVDDDNVLVPGYLEYVVNYFQINPLAGTIGGKIFGRFDGFEPPQWTIQFWNMLAIRDFGDETLLSACGMNNGYPSFAPVGAGMAIRKRLLDPYILQLASGKPGTTDRVGDSLSSGGDNEINIHILRQGYCVAYVPDLKIQHIIPEQRITRAYLSRLNYESSRSWAELLLRYDLSPWPPISKWSVGARKLKSWVSHRAWLSTENFIRWRGACGLFEGLANGSDPC
ncbi:MAG: glycosyltransferase [Bacteroidota bacterium]